MAGKTLRRRVFTYAAWHRLVRSWLLLQFLLFASSCAVAAYVVCDKIFYIGAPYSLIAAGAGSVGLLVLLGFHLFSARRLSLVCYLVDRSAGLKNLVASGLNVIDQSDAVSTLVVNRAEQMLDKRTPWQVLPFRTHWTGRFLYIPMLVLFASLLLPQMDWLKRKEKQEKAEVERMEVKKGALKLTAKLTSMTEKKTVFESIENKKITQDFDKLAKDLVGAAKKDALLKLGEFENKYRDELAGQRNFEKAAKSLQAKPNMDGLSPESQEQLKKLMKNLTQGNFQKSADAMRELAKQLQGKNLSAEQRKALARELAKMAEKTQGGGMSEDLAKLLRQIEGSPEDLQDLLRQCRLASQELAESAKFCDECEGLKAMCEGLAEAKGEMLGESFSGFNAKEVEQYMEAQAALGLKCEGCGGVGCGMCEEGKGMGGTGGKGKGQGGIPLENMTETSFKSKLSPSKVNKGKILHQLFVSGVPEKGDALVEYSEVVRAAKQDAASSLARERIPREYEDMVKNYFDSLETKRNDGQDAP